MFRVLAVRLPRAPLVMVSGVGSGGDGIFSFGRRAED
jgi:hypothetical protein